MPCNDFFDRLHSVHTPANTNASPRRNRSHNRFSLSKSYETILGFWKPSGRGQPTLKKPKLMRAFRRPLALAATVALTSLLFSPAQAFAVVRVDQTELAQGENAVGGGRATLNDSALDMEDVTAGELYTDEDLSVHFNGGNDIEDVTCAGSAEVELSFTGDNEVEEVHATESSDVTVNADGHNEFEELSAHDDANLTIKVTGENDFEEIVAHDNANITIRGTDCQRRDTVNLGEDEDDTEVSCEKGSLTIDHVTMNVLGKTAIVGSTGGDVRIDTSKIASEDDNENLEIVAGGTLDLIESVIDITGTMHSTGQMTIRHSDVDAIAPDDSYDAGPYRIWSEAGIALIDEKNGKVRKGALGDKTVYYVDTDDGKDVHLEADGEPAYYRCHDDENTRLAQTGGLPKTGDPSEGAPMVLLLAGGLVALATGRRMAALN